MVFVLGGIALSAERVLAGEDSTHRWFEYGMAWYEHPCSKDNLALFAVYWQWDTPENRSNYEITKRDPSQCAILFPMSPVKQSNGRLAALRFFSA